MTDFDIEKVKLIKTGIIRKGENNADCIKVENLGERNPDFSYYLLFISTDGKPYMIELPDNDLVSVPSDLTMRTGIIFASLMVKKPDGEIVHKSKKFSFSVEDSVEDGGAVPTYEVNKFLAEKVMESVCASKGYAEQSKQSAERAEQSAEDTEQIAKGINEKLENLSADDIKTNAVDISVQDFLDSALNTQVLGFGWDLTQSVVPLFTMSVKGESAEITLKRARGGYATCNFDPETLETTEGFNTKLGFADYKFFRKQEKNSDGTITIAPLDEPFPFGSLGRWDYLENKVEITRYSSEPVDILSVGKWELVEDLQPRDGYIVVRASFESLGMTDAANPETDDDESTFWMGMYEYQTALVSYNQLLNGESGAIDMGANFFVAVKDRFVYWSLPSSNIDSTKDLTSEVHKVMTGCAYFQGFYKKNTPILETASEPFKISVYGNSPEAFVYAWMPLSYLMVDFGVNIVPDAVLEIQKNNKSHKPNERGTLYLADDSAFYGETWSVSSSSTKNCTIKGRWNGGRPPVAGEILGIKFLNGNAAANFSISAFGEVIPAKYKGKDIPPKMIRPEQIAIFQYDGSYWNLLNPVSEDWQVLPLEENVVALTTPVPAFRKGVDGVVRLSGTVVYLGENVVEYAVGRLPSGYRPIVGAAENWPVVVPATGLGVEILWLYIDPNDGRILLNFGNEDSRKPVCLDSISFRAE